jgi:hypothetical protein
MWPLVGLLLLVVGAAAAKQRNKSSPESNPLEDEPDPAQTAAEAVQVAKDAVDQASAGAAQGTPEGAQQAQDALDQAAEATTAAAGSEVSPLLEQLTKQVEALAKAAAARAGVPGPPETSPGQPPLPTPKTEPTVVVEPAPPKGAPLPPVPKVPATPTASFPTAIPKSIDEAIAAADQVAKSLPIPVAVQKPTEAPPPLATEETKPQADPNGTVKLARQLLDSETRTGWRTADQAAVKAWQARMKLVADGKFGVKSAMTMADEVGVLPLVRFWPSASASKSSALKKYRNDLHTKAATIEAQGHGDHARALEVSADREDARSFGNPNPAPVTGAERLAALAALTQKVA